MQLVVYLLISAWVREWAQTPPVQSNFEGKKEEKHQQNKFETAWEELQVNLCQKLLFLHQLTHNMTSDCSLNYKFNTYMKIPSSNLRRSCVQKGYPTEIVTDIQNNFCTQHVLTVFCKMRRASNKYLPVKTVLVKSIDTVNERRISKC